MPICVIFYVGILQKKNKFMGRNRIILLYWLNLCKEGDFIVKCKTVEQGSEWDIDRKN